MLPAKKLSIIKVNNPFNRYDKDIEVIDYEYQNLLELRTKLIPEEVEVTVSVNGKVIPEEELALYYPQEGDQILFVPKVTGGGGDGKNILRTVAMLVVVVASAILAPQIATGLLGISASSAYYATAVGLIGAGLMLVGGLLINALLPVKLPKLGEVGEVDVSPNYSWNPQTTQMQGYPIPRIYGRHKTVGNIISSYISNDGEKNYINILVDLGLGPYKSVSDIRINDQPITNFPDVQYDVKLGRIQQGIINGFNQVKTEYVLNQEITYTNQFEFYTTGNDFDALEVDIAFPNGLYQINNSGGTEPITDVSFTIRAIKLSDNNVIEKNLTVSGDGTTKAIRRTVLIELSIGKGYYKIVVTRNTPNADDIRKMDKSYVSIIREVFFDDFIYPRQALVGIKALATEHLSGSIRFSCIVEGALVRIWNGSSWIVDWTDNPAWICYDILTQPVFDDGNNVVRYDGIHPSRIDHVKFKEWADFCDALCPDGKGGLEKRITFNGIFDSEMTLWEAALAVCQIGRATLVWNGIKITVVVDKPTTPVQLFSIGNIGLNSFNKSYLPMEDRAAEIEIDFTNSERNYERTKFSVINPNIKSITNKVNLQAFGITKPSEAWRFGMYRLAMNEYLKETITFEADIDSIACTIGDVINVQYSVLNWQKGYGGRIESATTTSITLDREVTLAGGTYAIVIRRYDDVVFERTITNPAGTYKTVNISSAINPAPQPYDVYSIGEVSKVTKPYRIIAISRTEEQKATITAIEYKEEIYNYDNSNPVLPELEPPPTIPIGLEPVTNLTLKEISELNENGIIKRSIDVSYIRPNYWKKGRIFYRKETSTTWTLAGETISDVFRIENVEPDMGYFVLVQTVGLQDEELPLSFCPVAYIKTSTGAGYIDVMITGLQIEGQGNNTNFVGKNVTFVWNDVSGVPTEQVAGQTPYVGYGQGNTWFKDYVVTIYDKFGNIRRVEYVVEPRYTYSYDKNVRDGNGFATRTITIEVRARDKAFRVSRVPARLTAVNPPPEVPELIAIKDHIESIWVMLRESRETDWEGFIVWASKENNFVPSAANEVYRGKDTFIQIPIKVYGTWYVRYAAYDSFGTDELNISQQYSVNVMSLIDDVPPIVPQGLQLQTGVLTSESGGMFAYIKATWTANTEEDLAYYELRVREENGDYIYYTVGTNEMLIQPCRPNITHYVSVRAVDTSGNVSAYCEEVSIVTARDTTPPANPTSLTATASFKTIFLEWTNPTDKDLNYIEVWRSDNNNLNNATLIAKIKADFYGDNIGTYGTTKYYWIRAVDLSGNASSFVGPVSATTQQVVTVDVADFGITEAKLAEAAVTTSKLKDLAVTEAKLAEAAVTTSKIEDDAITEAKIKNAAISSAKIAEAAILTAHIKDGAIINAKIANAAVNSAKIAEAAVGTAHIQDGAIINAKIANAAVNSAKIAEAAVGTAHIQDGAIINAKIANAAVNSAKIAEAAVGTAHIQDGAIVNAKIADAAVDTAKIQDLAVTNAKIANATITSAKISSIDSNKIVISGSTMLSDWRHGGDTTAIDGGKIAANTITANKLVIGSRNISITGIEFSANYPQQNRVYWTSGTISYVNDSGTTTTVYVNSGSALWNGGTLYLYWTKDTNYISYTTSASVAHQANNVVMATYEGGTGLLVNYGRTIIDGSHIQTGTITANQLIKTQNLITESVQIKDGIITNAKIVDLAAEKITSGYISAARIAAGTITADHLVSSLYGELTNALSRIKECYSSQSWQVPQGVRKLWIFGTGAGGGGCSGGYRHPVYNSGWQQFLYGGGGGSGEYRMAVVYVNPGDILNIYVGAGGSGGSSVQYNYGNTPYYPNPGGRGGSTYITKGGDIIFSAEGGDPSWYEVETYADNDGGLYSQVVPKDGVAYTRIKEGYGGGSMFKMKGGGGGNPSGSGYPGWGIGCGGGAGGVSVYPFSSVFLYGGGNGANGYILICY